MNRPLAALAVAVASLVSAAPASAGDPVMPLSQVHGGMHCTGYSVVKGTDVASFNVDVIDVTEDGILVSVSGPAVDQTGLGEGFSGSPIYCPDGHGVSRNIGAIAYSVGDYGNRKALATPIELILASPVKAPRRAGGRKLPADGTRKLPPGVRPLLAPLTVTGLSAPIQKLVSRAGKRAGRVVLAAPATARASFPPQFLRPGSSLSVGLSSGDIELSAIGTVAYTDGANVWGFGHALDAAGARSLLLQDAYVYDVINNPIGADGLTTYKLAAPGHDLGTLSDDTLDAVVGSVGALPSLIPVVVNVRDLDRGATEVTRVQVTDETALGLPSALDFVAPIAVGDAGVGVLDSFPPEQSGTLCMRIRIRERKTPLRFCNRYAGPATDLMIDDSSRAIALVLDYKSLNPRRLHLLGIDATEGIARGVKQDFIASAASPRRVHRGRRVRVRIRLRRDGVLVRTMTLRVRVPRSLPRGRAVMKVSGTPIDGEPFGLLDELVLGPGPRQDRSRPRSLSALVRRVAAIHRFHGVNVSFRPPGKHRRARRVRVAVPSADPILRISGSARRVVIVR
jgi:hypothetical protein